MKSKRFVVAWCLLLLLAGSGLAVAQEQGRIEGRVTREDGSGITGVSVRLDQLDQVVLSDAMGNFAFADVPPGSYTTDPEIQSGKKFMDQGLQTAAGVPLQCDEGADFMTFRVGLFGLEKWHQSDRTVGQLAAALDRLGLPAPVAETVTG